MNDSWLLSELAAALLAQTSPAQGRPIGGTLIPDLVAVLLTAGLAAGLCRKIKVSTVIGYLLTGIIVGPFTRPSLVSSFESIHTLANLGLVFVMFFIGLELSPKRLKSLGAAPILVTLLTALLIFNGVRLGGGLFEFDGVQSLFVAGTIMVSSSVIVNRVLGEMDLSREPFARNAIGVTLLEDAVAVSMLAILGSIDGVSGEAGAVQPDVVPLVGRLMGFVLLAVLGALLLVPRLLDRVNRLSREVTSVLTVGLLLGLAYTAARAGYSLALGAFLLGSVVGGTRHKVQFLQSFEGMHDVFAAVFFVSMGMLYDVRLFTASLPMALGLALCASAGRVLAAAAAFLMAGKPLDFSVKAAFCLVPLGEFSFVIAELGVRSGKMPETFFPACVGAVLLTTIAAPWLTRLGILAGEKLGRREPAFLASWRGFWTKLKSGGGTSFLSRFKGSGLSGKAVQVGLGTAVILSLLAFSGSIADWLRGPLEAPLASLGTWLEEKIGAAAGGLFDVAFWCAFAAVLFAPCFAVWKGLVSAARIAAQVIVGTRPEEPMSGAQKIFGQTVEKSILAGGLTVFTLLVGAVLPDRIPLTGKSLIFLVLLVLIAALIRAPLSRWQAKVQADIAAEVSGAPASGGSAAAEAPGALAEAAASLASEAWRLHVRELRIGSESRPAGMSLAETGLRSRFGCSVAAIDRQGIVLANPAADTRLFPEDRVLLVGTQEQLDQAAAWLSGRAEEAQERESLPFSDLTAESVTVPSDFAHAGATLAQLGIAGRFRVTLLGIERSGRLIQNPAGDQVIDKGDRLLVLGFPGHSEAFRAWMCGQQAGAAAEGAPAAG